MNLEDIMQIIGQTGSISKFLGQYGINQNNYNEDKIEALLRKFNFSKAQVKNAMEQIEGALGIAKNIPFVSKYVQNVYDNKVQELKQGINKVFKLDENITYPSYDQRNQSEYKDTGIGYGVRTRLSDKYPD